VEVGGRGHRRRSMNDLRIDAVVRRDRFELAVALSAAPGEIVGLVGGVGSGKSTVLELVAGKVRAARGTVHGPQAPWDDPQAGVWVPGSERAVSHLAQRVELDDEVFAVDQVAASLAPGGGNGAAHVVRRDALSLLDELGVHPGVASRPGWTLSGGEAQRVALAVAFARRSSILLLDDPFRALDSRSGIAVRRWIAEHLSRRGRTALVACSDPGDTQHLADRVVELP
jgi:molybdate transport system ATP-binding protein